MMELQPPQPIINNGLPKLFLAGSIEMGVAVEWQRAVIGELQDESVLILNPRRTGWDSSWKQSIDNPVFKEQVLWEHNGLLESDYILFYFDPATKSPITMFEFGLVVQSKKIIMVCPQGFWRKGNIDIVCERYGISQHDTLPEAIHHIKTLLRSHKA